MNLSREIRKRLYWNDPSYRIPFILFICILLIVAMVIFCFALSHHTDDKTDTILVYCFSGMEDVMEEAILPAFQAYWYENTGKEVKFITTYSGSGSISNRTFSRFRAQIIILASEMDAHELALKRIVNPGVWQALPEAGKLCYSPIILYSKTKLARSDISLQDLDYENSKIVITNPVLSGAGKWALLALYGSMERENITESEAYAHMEKIVERLIISPLTAKETFESFTSSRADFLISYESFGLSDFYGEDQRVVPIYPLRTIAAEPIVVPVSRNIWEGDKALVGTFIQYLWSWEAQTLLMDYGFRVHYEDFQKNTHQADSQDIFRADSLGTPENLLRKIINPLIQADHEQRSTQLFYGKD